MRFLYFVLDCAICFGLLDARLLGCNMLYLSVEMKYPSHPKKKRVHKFENANLFSDNLYLIRVYTFPAPEQFGHLLVVGTCKGRSETLDTERGSMLKHTPLAEHRAQAK